MGLFSAAPAAQRPVPPSAFEQSVAWGVVKWGGLQALAPWQQVGAWGEARLNADVANWPGLQRWNGVMGLNPGWIAAGSQGIPYWQLTTAVGNYPGAQRNASWSGIGTLGPITSRQATQNVTLAQLRQNGLQNTQFARDLFTIQAGGQVD